MLTPDAGSVKKVQFYAVAALMLCGLQAGAAELSVPIEEVQQQLTLKAEESFSRALEECERGKQRSEGAEEPAGPRYPVRIAAGGVRLLFTDKALAAP